MFHSSFARYFLCETQPYIDLLFRVEIDLLLLGLDLVLVIVLILLLLFVGDTSFIIIKNIYYNIFIFKFHF